MRMFVFLFATDCIIQVLGIENLLLELWRTFHQTPMTPTVIVSVSLCEYEMWILI